MGDTYTTTTVRTTNKIDVGTEVNTYYDEGLNAIAEAQKENTKLTLTFFEKLKKIYENTVISQYNFNNRLFDAAKIIVLIIFILYLINYYNEHNKKGKKQ